jgi:O-antigen/teichoic acid export membrane protein
MAQQIQICYTWLNRMENYNVLMKNPVLNQIVYGVVGILLGMLGFIQYGFFIAHIIGSFVTLINMKRNLPKGLLTFNYNEVFITLKENKNFAIFQMPTNITSNLKSQAPTLLIKVLWGTEILGYYSMTIRILQVPISLLSKAIGRVFFQVISKIKRQGKNIGEYVINNLLKAMKISIVPISLLVAFGDIVTIAFLGDEWEIAGDFVRILALQYFFMFLQGSVQGLAITLDKQKYAMIANISQVVGLFISTLVGKYTFDSIHITLILIALFYIVIQTVYFSSLFKLMNIAIARYIKSIIVGVIVIAALSTVLRRMFNYLELVNILNNI